MSFKSHIRVAHTGLDILGRPQNGLAVDRQGLGIGALCLSYLSIDLAEIEQAPAQARGRLRLERAAGEQMAGVQALEPEQARQRDLGVIVRDRLADPRVGGGQVPLGRDHVGTAA